MEIQRVATRQSEKRASVERANRNAENAGSAEVSKSPPIGPFVRFLLRAELLMGDATKSIGNNRQSRFSRAGHWFAVGDTARFGRFRTAEISLSRFLLFLAVDLCYGLFLIQIRARDPVVIQAEVFQ